VAEVVQNAAFEAQCRGITLQASIPASELRVFGNATLLYSAVENAVRNAIQYTDPETEVGVKVSVNGEKHVCIHISDSGPGVPESELENIFRPFYRVDECRDRSIGGTGLGLAIAGRVLRLHHGAISARNQAPKGMLIEMVLPLAEVDAPA
jgi:two-component system, OmpR family, sensor histidine kinase CpxA